MDVDRVAKLGCRRFHPRRHDLELAVHVTFTLSGDAYHSLCNRSSCFSRSVSGPGKILGRPFPRTAGNCLSRAAAFLIMMALVVALVISLYQ